MGNLCSERNYAPNSRSRGCCARPIEQEPFEYEFPFNYIEINTTTSNARTKADTQKEVSLHASSIEGFDECSSYKSDIDENDFRDSITKQRDSYTEYDHMTRKELIKEVSKLKQKLESKGEKVMVVNKKSSNQIDCVLNTQSDDCDRDYEYKQNF